MNTQVVVVIGAGGIGQAIASRQGSGKAVLLADLNAETLASAAKALEARGHNVVTRPVDVASRESVHTLAEAAAALGDLVQVVDTVRRRGLGRPRRPRQFRQPRHHRPSSRSSGSTSGSGSRVHSE